MIETEIRSLLVADAAVSGLVAERIYALTVPQKPKLPSVPWLPAVTFQRISRIANRTSDGHVGPDRMRIQIDAWATTYVEAKALGEAVRLALEGRSVDDDEKLLGIFLEGDGDFYEPDVAGSSLFRFSSDWIVWAAVAAA